MDENRRAFLDEPGYEPQSKVGFKLSQFIKSFIITMLSLILIVVGTGGFFVLRIAGGIPSAPEIPSVTAPPAVQRPNPNIPEDEQEYPDDNDDFTQEWVPRAPEGFTDENRKEDFFTFLIVGLNEGTNANTVMVASIDINNNEINIISIPRDSMLNVSRPNPARKLSSSYMVGAAAGRGRAGGVANIQREVMGIIGFMPDFYIIIDYDAFFAIIDVVGGVEIYVPFHMRYDDPFQDLHIDIQPGLQLMDSKTALHFARFRRANANFTSITDYQRIANQQTVIDAVLAKVLTPRTLIRINEFIRVFDESVYSNLDRNAMAWFAQNHFSPFTSRGVINFYTTPMIGSSREPYWYEILNPGGIVELVNRTINPFNMPILRSHLDIITEVPER